MKQLCMAGGVGLNSVANTRILHESDFEQLYVQPAAGDGGGALGALCGPTTRLLGHPRNFTMKHAYWGSANSEGEISDFLVQNNIPHRRLSTKTKLVDTVVDRLDQCQGRGLVARPLRVGAARPGSRSILADPRNPEMKDIVNSKIKFREPYRPFAPSVLAESRGEILRSAQCHQALSRALHAYVVPVDAGAPHTSRDYPRRRHWPAANCVQRAKPALLQTDRALWPGHGRPGGYEYVFQLER